MGAPSIKIRKVEQFCDKISSTACKRSNLNAQSTETPVSHSIWSESLSPIFSPCCFLSSSLSGVIRNGSPSIMVRRVVYFWDKISSTGCKWSNLNAQSTETPVSHSILRESLFPNFTPCCFLSSSLWGNKKWELPV